uniref:LIC10906 family membrane protein n=1 Tax=Leptospira alstonii TaxID=28452 RepID=UPI000773D8C3
MNIAVAISLLCSVSVLFLGIYVIRLGHRKNPKIPKYFFGLSLSISLWTFLSGIRYILPTEIYAIAPSMTLLPVIFVPFLLNQLIMNLIQADFKQKKIIVLFHAAILVYLFLSCVSFNMIEMIDYQTSSYKPLLAYHTLITYSFGSVGFSIFLILKKTITSSGSERVQFTLLGLGVLISLSTTILLVYILPTFGIFKGYFIPMGFIPSSFLWAVAILQYDVFETKAAMLSGGKVPYLNRITLSFYLTLFRHLDPNEFRDKSVALKTALTTDMLYTDMNLVFN